MKKITNLLYITLSLVAISLIASCSLDEDPKYTLNTKTIFSDKTAAETSLYQCYGHLGSQNLYGQFIHQVTIANGFAWAKTDGNTKERTITYDAFAEDGAINGVWKGFYKVIAESNYFIDGIEKSDLSQENKNRFLAHAHFLRGFAYFKLANMFGKALIITDPITTENLESPIKSKEEVYTQALNDLTYAEENMKEEQEERVGMANKYTVAAYLARCYWIMASQKQGEGADASDLWQKAKTYGDKVINSGKYALEANYTNLFKSHIGDSKESIFQINFSIENGVKNRSNFNFGPNGGYASTGSKSWGNIKVDRAFYDLQRGTHPDDPRMESTYLTTWTKPNAKNPIYAYPYVLYVDWSTGKKEEILYDMGKAPILNNDRKNPEYDFGAMPKKVQDYWEGKAQWDKNMHPYNAKMADINASNSQYDTKNMIIFRYADLLLLMADVENELGNQTKAIDYVNQVLTRARQSASGAENPKNISSIGQKELREYIFFERMFEMAGETELFEDIRRRGTEYLKKVIQIHNDNYLVKYRYKIETDNNIKGAFRDYIINKGNITEDFLKKNLVLPIPSDEINYNDKVTQEDQNFGY